MNKSKTDLLDLIVNPIVGCKNGCEYCYARYYNEKYKIIPNFEEPKFFKHRFSQFAKETEPAIIYIGSMADVFGPWIESEWIQNIIDEIAKNQHHWYMFLTKFPQRYHEFSFPDHVMLGTTLDDARYSERVDILRAYNKSEVGKLVSVEPLLTDMSGVDFSGMDLVTVGAMTGPNAVRPKLEWVLSVKHDNIRYMDNILNLFPQLKKTS